MNRYVACTVVVALAAAHSGLAGEPELIPWTTAETDQFAGGGSWLGNTLTLTYPPGVISTTVPHQSFDIPPNAIGISFDVGGTLPNSRADVQVQVHTAPPEWDSVGGNKVSNEFTAEGQYRWGDLTDWTFIEWSPLQFSELSETTSA